MAAIPVMDALLDQAGAAFTVNLGGLSLLQGFRGGILALFVVVAVSGVHRLDGLARRLLLACSLFITAVIFTATREYLQTGVVASDNVVAYFQIFYWVTFWAVTLIACDTPQSARLILKGVVAGGLIAAGSVYVAYILGVGNTYQAQGISASAGWFDTGKWLAGSLLAACYSAIYFGRQRRPWLLPIAAACMGAMVLTYARAGILAGIVSLAWLFLTNRGKGTHSSSRVWAYVFLALLAIGSATFAYRVGLADMGKRWSDMSDPDKRGSGRGMFWEVALESYLRLPISDQIFGVGYDGTRDIVQVGYGMRIHTHSDVLDALLVAGAPGIIGLFAIWFSLGWLVRRMPKNSPERATAGAVACVLICQGITTGQIFGPGVMSCYLLTITCLARLSGVSLHKRSWSISEQRMYSRESLQFQLHHFPQTGRASLAK